MAVSCLYRQTQSGLKLFTGPRSCWLDSWAVRWNPQFYASQGYVTVALDPTGSSSYGQVFTDAVKGEWGGLPFEDLVAGYHHCLKAYEEIDPERTVALGASYGGYMGKCLPLMLSVVLTNGGSQLDQRSVDRLNAGTSSHANRSQRCTRLQGFGLS